MAKMAGKMARQVAARNAEVARKIQEAEEKAPVGVARDMGTRVRGAKVAAMKQEVAGRGSEEGQRGGKVKQEASTRGHAAVDMAWRVAEMAQLRAH